MAKMSDPFKHYSDYELMKMLYERRPNIYPNPDTDPDSIQALKDAAIQDRKDAVDDET